MNKLRKLTLAGFLACSSFTTVAQAQNSTTLQRGNPIERELGPSQSHTFTVDVEANSYLQLVVEQKGIDVVIAVTAPNGKVIGNYDTTNGANGPENVSFLALTAGTYSITVGPLEPAKTPKGRYQIKIVEQRKATDEEQKSKQAREIARTKAIELLKELEGIISQVKTPATRIKARMRAADLLWEEDEKRASKFLSEATTDLKELVSSLDVNGSEYAQQYAVVWQLRFAMVQLLAEIDPEKALNLLYSTAPPIGPFTSREQSSQESGLELIVAGYLMERDPQRSFQIARQSLKQGYSQQLLTTVEELKRRDPKLAAELANEMIEKLLTEKLIENSDAGQMALSLLGGTRVDVSSITIGEKRPDIISDEKYKELVRKIVNETLNTTPSSATALYQTPILWNLLHRLRSMAEVLDTIVPGSSAAIEKKYSLLTAGIAPAMLNQPTLSDSDSIEESVETIEKAPVEARDQLYYMLAHREAAKGDVKGARELLNDRVKVPHLRRDWLKQIEQQEISTLITNGKFEDAMRVISALRTPQERATYLTQLITHIHVNQKPANALNLLEQARALLPASPMAQDEQQMNALFEIARAFSMYDPKRAFEIMEPLVDQLNEILAAARMLHGFGGDFFYDDELMEDGSSLAMTASQMTSTIGYLGLTNFERAKSISDRIRLPELRLRAYLDMATQALEGESQE